MRHGEARLSKQLFSALYSAQNMMGNLVDRNHKILNPAAVQAIFLFLFRNEYIQVKRRHLHSDEKTQDQYGMS